MKQIWSAVLILSVALSLCGCMVPVQEIQEPVNFYYLRSELTFGQSNSVILAEARESAGHSDDYIYLLTQYLKGPASGAFAQTFPRGVTVVAFHLNEQSAAITLNDSISVLSGLDLTIACACITRTIAEMTGVETVTISAENALLDGSQSITMSLEDILLLDDSTAEPIQ